jgi:general secretion pathway protein M
MAAALPTGRRGQILALAITVLPLLLLWVGVAAPLFDFYTERAAQLTQHIQLAQRMARVTAELPALRDRVATTAKTETSPSQTLDGASDAVAAAALQNRVQEMATTVGASLASVEILEVDTTGGYRRIGLRLTLNASWPVLIGLLRAIELSPLPMVVDGLQIHAASSPANEPRSLEASFSVIAFRSAEPSIATVPEKAL